MPSMPGYFVGKGYQFLMLDRQFGGNEAEYMAAYEAALGRTSRSATWPRSMPIAVGAARRAEGR